MFAISIDGIINNIFQSEDLGGNTSKHFQVHVLYVACCNAKTNSIISKVALVTAVHVYHYKGLLGVGQTPTTAASSQYRFDIVSMSPVAIWCNTSV